MDKPSEEYLAKVKASLVDSSQDFIGIADAEGKLIYLNDAAYRLMGYSPGERPVFNTIADLHANDFDKFALSVIQPTVMAEGFWTGTGFLRHKDGRAMEVSQTVFPVVGENGEFYGTAAVMKDISELLQANDRLAKSSELFQKVLDSAKIGIVLINMESNTIDMVNRFTEELLQMSADEIVGSKCYDILCHRDPSICPHVNERDKDTIVAERFIERSDGTFIPVIKSGTWIRIEDKEYLVDTFADISIQKNLEKDILEAKAAAEAASRSKSVFLSSMSHEMRTPLNAVIGMTQIAARTDDISKLRDALNTIEVSSRHLLDLINDILDLSKIEEGKLELAPEPFSLRAMIQKISSLMEAKAREKHINFVVREQNGLPDALVGDSMRISQVLLNFLSNAVKFTPEHGSVTLEVELVAMDAGAAQVYFAVSDDGIGISEEQLPLLFQPFVQADSSTYKKFGGTGLGLAISKQIINLMGADIEVASTYGEGAKFSFVLKLPPAGSVFREDADADIGGDTSGIFNGKRVLIVDDMPVNRIIATEFLAGTGAEVSEAADGGEAVELAGQDAYDVILMDVMMPVMDGYEATRRIRAGNGPSKDAVIIAMSANAFREDTEKSLEAGMDGHIGKPVDLNAMIATMYTLLSSGKQRRKGASTSGKDAMDRLLDAMEARDYRRAMEYAKEIRNTYEDTPAVASYAQNVYECLDREDFDYAKMYLADLVKAYNETNNK